MEKLAHNIRTLSPVEAGRVYGAFAPSLTGHVKVLKEDGSIVEQPLTRRERRLLARRVRRG